MARLAIKQEVTNESGEPEMTAQISAYGGLVNDPQTLETEKVRIWLWRRKS